MPDFTPQKAEVELVERLVEYYRTKQQTIQLYLESLQAQVFVAVSTPPLSELVHSVKRRLKSPEHLRDKLLRKVEECHKKGVAFDLTEDNLLVRINDLGGYRILHLHTRQMEHIHTNLLKLLEDANWDHHAPPFAHIWDEESAKYFESLGIKTEVNPRLYTSVHYVVRPKGKEQPTVEIQVRTLADEIWGEVDHKINYPYPHENLACREQIRVLARVASSCSRLVDSIMATNEDWAAAGPPDIEPIAKK